MPSPQIHISAEMAFTAAKICKYGIYEKYKNIFTGHFKKEEI